jgi:anti-sigma regulatory factor (Ser/Thr protein kinase)
VSLCLEARPANATLARRAVTREAEHADLDPEAVAAAQVVVTEGFSNAVRHAYPGNGGGIVQIEARGEAGGITIVVRDRGDGFRPRPRRDGGYGGIGLLLVAALAQEVQLRHLHGGGTEMRARVVASAADR